MSKTSSDNNSMQPVRGTQDILPLMAEQFRFIDDTAFNMAQRFGYAQIATPIFEFTSVFHRTLGETSDAVTKETYTFIDRSGDSLTLRPEGTAGIARAFISNGLTQNLPLKLYYSGPMFRHERPQKGRYRQFHQIGAENLGPDTAEADAESIALGNMTLKELGLADKVKLEINSLGDVTSRHAHREALVKYLAPFQTELSLDSQNRLLKNPLRILDSKDEKDRKLLQTAPRLKDFLNSESKLFFENVLKRLQQMNIPFTHQENLVRGFDYYTHSVFEFVTDQLGAQSAVLSGGRYNGLIELMGGPSTPGVGWAAGVERIALMLAPRAQKNQLLGLAAVDESSEDFCFMLAHQLREQGLRVELLSGSNVGKKMKRSAKLQTAATVLVGETERQNKTFAVKDMATGTQSEMTLTELIAKYRT